MRSANNLRSATYVRLQTKQNYQGLVNDANPSRYYRLQLNRRSSLSLSLSGLQANANLALVNRNGKTLYKSTQNGQRQSIARTVKPGTYYIHVARQQGKTRYQLRINVDTPQPNPAPPSVVTTGNALTDRVFVLVNQYRTQAGLKPLRLDARLNAAAQAHSQDMALNDFFSHTGSSGSTADRRILAAGYNYATVGENIAAGFSTPEGVVAAWMNSPSHRDNILHPLLEEVGVGLYFLENDGGEARFEYYWTQDFGKPMP
jgi:uncharacterized protein YkwD